jgi:2',3'-cyclic-nucleotide 2'-phosphodiesterase (5'-nucleotidase family)
LFRKTISILIALALASVSVLSQSASPENAPPASFEERLGPDDGAALAILIGANMRGLLDLCDCNHPRGGLARRVGYVEVFKKRFKHTPVIHVEAGFFLADSSNYLPPVMLQNEQVVRGLGRWNVDVVNLGRYDLLYAQKLLVREGLAERTNELPLIKNMISANGVFGTEVAQPAPYIIKEVRGPRIKNKSKKLRVGFLGLAEPIKPAEGRDGTVTDLFEAARRVVPQLRKQCDILVIVAHSEHKAALRLATENPEADIVIAGNAEAIYKPRQVGNTMVICAASGNTQQGDLRVYIDEQGHKSYKFLSLNLDSTVPADPAAAAYVDSARLEREKKGSNR